MRFLTEYVETVLAAVLKEAVKRIAKKVSSGKRLTDSEIAILILDQMSKRIDARFDTVDVKFSGILAGIRHLEKRVDERFTSLERRIDERFRMVDERFKMVDERFISFERRIDERFNSLKDYVDGRLGEMSKRIDDLSMNIQTLAKEIMSIKTDVIKILTERR